MLDARSRRQGHGWPKLCSGAGWGRMRRWREGYRERRPRAPPAAAVAKQAVAVAAVAEAAAAHSAVHSRRARGTTARVFGRFRRAHPREAEACELRHHSTSLRCKPLAQALPSVCDASGRGGVPTLKLSRKVSISRLSSPAPAPLNMPVTGLSLMTLNNVHLASG